MSKKENVTETAQQEKVVTKYDRKIQKRKEQEEKEKREKRIGMAVGIVIAAALVCLVASFPIRTYLAVNETFVEVGGEKVTKLEFDYNYNLVTNNYINQYGSYLSYFGLDTTKDLSTQMYSDTLTWEDYFQQMTVDTIKRNKALMAKAREAGFTYDTKEDFKEYEVSLKAAAAEQGVTLNNYLKSSFGSYATLGRLESFVKNGMVVSAFYEQVSEEKAPAEEEIQTYYDENKASYDSVDFRMEQINAELPTEPTELADPVDETETEAEDGEEQAYVPSEAEVAAAMAVAKEQADAAQKTIAADGELTENATSSSLNSYVSEWLFDDARKAGDTTVIENTASNCYYVVAFEKRYLDETPSANARVIMSQSTDAQTILDEWKGGEATEDSFIELVAKYSEDTYTSGNGGLYEGLTKSGLDESISSWLFEDGRTAGDTTAITMEGETPTNYVLYYIGEGDPQWKLSIRSTLLSNKLNEYLEEIAADVVVEDPKGNLNYLKAEAAASAAAESSEAAQGTDSGEQGESSDSTEGSESSEASAESSAPGETESGEQSSESSSAAE